MGASTGVFGTARAQMVLRQVLTHIGALVLPKPEVMVAKAQDAFDEQGKLVNETTRGFLKDLLVALADWTRRVKD
jgi:chromate reductase